MAKPTVLVTLESDATSRGVFAKALGDVADVVFLSDISTGARAAALASATIIIARNTSKELQAGEEALIHKVRLLQFVTAGVDYIPLRHLPPGLPIASNGGAYSEPMAEHAVAMAFAAAKRLLIEHQKLVHSEFDQFRPNRMLAGAVCGILGFGGIGVATARLMRGLGLKIHAINRRGASDEPVDWIGRPNELDTLLAAADVLVVSLPLTRGSDRLIRARELSLMKRDAILINLARGEIIDEAALYQHLKANPAFTACIDAWWIEPVRHGRFAMEQPFLELPNVIGSPHNSASVKGWREVALTRAAANCRRVLEGLPPWHMTGPDERIL